MDIACDTMVSVKQKRSVLMKPLELNELEFSRMLESGEAFLVDYWAPWCVYCRRIAPAYEKLAEQYEGKLKIAKVNIDENPALADREHIEVIPTLVLYSGGKAQGFVVAPDSKAAMEEFIEGLI